MPLLAGSPSSRSLLQVLRTVAEVRPTGYVKLKEGERTGCIGVENGVILNARTGSATGLPALFEFVTWREALLDFQERPLAAEASRELAAYDPQVLISGMAFKVEEQNLVLDAMPSLDAVVRACALTRTPATELTPWEVQLLALADGRHTVRQIAENVQLGASEIARQFARLRLAGLIAIVEQKVTRTAMAA